MNSKTTDEFRKAFANLPKEIQAKARSKFRLWKDNPKHQSLSIQANSQFKTNLFYKGYQSATEL